MTISHKRFLIFGVAMLFAASLNAGSIGPTCGSCFGGVYTLTNVGMTSSTGTTQTWEFKFTIDTSGYTGATGNYISTLAAKVSSSLLGSSLISSPSGTGTWSTSNNTNVNNNGCAGNGSGWVCFSGGQALVKSTTPYTWDFTVTVSTGSLLSLASIQANYDPPKGLIMSETVAMPEGPATELPLALLGLGALLWCVKRSPAGFTGA